MKKIAILFFVILPMLITAQRPEMVEVQGGTFTMGNASSASIDEKPEHQVTLNTFYMSKYEVTYDDFDLFCNATGYPKPRDGGFGRGTLPVMNVSWEGAIKYCNWMSRRFNLDKVYDITIDSNGMKINSIDWNADGYRLPTEAEWEFAARGGTLGGINSSIEQIAWFDDNSDGKPHPVGELEPNNLGIYDIQGNAWEWCWDFYSKEYYADSPSDNPYGPNTGGNKVYRGGNFSAPVDYLSVNKRYSLSPKLNDGMIGFRLVRSQQ